MKTNSARSLLLSYIRLRRGFAFLLLCLACVFALVFSLYDLPVEAVLYASVLCLFILMGCVLVDFWLMNIRHRRLVRLQQEILLTAPLLPPAQNVYERDYQELLGLLLAQRWELETAAGSRHDNLVEYFTLWAHQIKTPIAAMRLLLEGDSTPDPAELRAALFRIEQYVEMVLGYLHLSEDGKDLVLRTQPLDPIVRQVIHKFAPLFVRKRITLDYRPFAFATLTDEKWLSFALSQLLDNALKYTAQGKITIAFEAPAILTITDTGIGIAPEDLPRVFEKGYTGINGRADKRATGIGLYLVQTAMGRLNHGISLTSVPGQGTRVSIDFSQVDLQVE